MEQRRTPTGVARNVIVAASTQGTTLNTLAEATDMDGSDLRERLDESSDFTWDELAHLGGLFSIHPATLLAGAS
jgi:hypothetical protein